MVQSEYVPRQVWLYVHLETEIGISVLYTAKNYC